MSNASKVLIPGIVYTGQITARQGDGTYRVAVDDPRVTVSGVRLALAVLGGHLGLQVKGNLPRLTKVKFVYGAPSFIFATIPTASSDLDNGRNRSLLWGKAMDKEQGVAENLYSDHPEDMLEGEVEFVNLYGISLQFLTTLMRMTAGDRASVECHLINDMVRVISAQWRHISGLGDDLIFDHGRPTLERNWSMYRHEVLGALAEKAPYADLNGDEIDRKTLDAKRVTALGRHRFREFVGFAGDFIHSFVSDPPATIVSLGEEAVAGAGKSWFHRNSDGSVLLQSIADIRLERVTRIPVPVRIAHHEDPDVTKAREYDSLEAGFLKLPKMVSPANPKDLYQMAYHLRSYSRWLGRYHSFARMLQQPGEYSIPSEAASPVPDCLNGEVDRRKSNGAVTYYETYACYAILRDGSIVQHDGYGSSIVTSNGNIQISAARHVDIEATGDLRLLAGGSIFLKARRNIELSATLGGLILHSYAWLKMLCEKGSLWLRSNATTDKSAAPEPAAEDAPTPEIAGWVSGSADGHAILVEASDGAAAYRSKKGVTLAVDGTPQDEQDPAFDVLVTTGGSAKIRGDQGMSLQTTQNMLLTSKKCAIASPTILTDATSIVVGPVTGRPTLVLRNGVLWCETVDTMKVRSNEIFGPERGPKVLISDAGSTLLLKRHFNHIDTLKSPVREASGAAEEDKAALQAAKTAMGTPPALPWGNTTAGPEWSFPAKTEYVWDTREKAAGAVPETLTQQYLRLDATGTTDQWAGPGYGDWEVRREPTGPRTARRGGFGYYELQYKADDAGENLHVPSPTAAKDMTEPVVSWRPKDKFTMKYLKR